MDLSIICACADGFVRTLIDRMYDPKPGMVHRPRIVTCPPSMAQDRLLRMASWLVIRNVGNS
jgi:hypothetical protein